MLRTILGESVDSLSEDDVTLIARRFVLEQFGQNLKLLKPPSKHSGSPDWGIVFEQPGGDGAVIDGPVVVLVTDGGDVSFL